jgi:molecular chaperone GrpE (heat shock protein)
MSNQNLSNFIDQDVIDQAIVDEKRKLDQACAWNHFQEQIIKEHNRKVQQHNEEVAEKLHIAKYKRMFEKKRQEEDRKAAIERFFDDLLDECDATEKI